MRRVVGLGAGGHAKVVIEILRLVGGVEMVGLLDPKPKLRGTEVLGIRVLGNDSLLSELFDQGVEEAFIGLGSIGDMKLRRELYEKARLRGFRIVEAIHPKAVISPSAKIGSGATILAGVVINASASLGENVIANTGAIIEHDCMIRDHVHIATGVRLASNVEVKEGAHIGIGASVRQCIRIGQNSIIGAGAVVVKDVPDNVTVGGVPARIIKTTSSR